MENITIRITILLVSIICIFVIALSILPACTLETPKPLPTLEDTTWVLQAYGQPGSLKSVLTGVGKGKEINITAVFNRFGSTSGQVAGFSGVNTYTGNYKLENSRLTVSEIMLTALAGPQPLLDQENEFLKLLKASDSYEISGDQLQINCEQQELIFIEHQ